MDLNLDINQALIENELSGEGRSLPDRVGVTSLPIPPPIVTEKSLSPAMGRLAFLVSEVALFGTLITAYVTYLGQDVSGPTPREALSLPLALVTTVCLLTSSGTIHLAENRLHEGRARDFLRAWVATIALGFLFLLGTAYEWGELIVEHHLTISRNLFGTTFYTLVGFHGLHVTIGLIVMLGVLGLMIAGKLSIKSQPVVQLASWYWHFVDVVWIVVFSLVYLIGR